jgi:hypothetical protein
MPSATHIFAGLVVGLLLYQVSRKRFTPYHVMLISIQSIIGPDLGWLFPDATMALFFHSAFGFAVWAFVIAIPFSIVGRALADPMRYSDAYKLTLAGGITHFCIDGLGHLVAGTSELEPFSLFTFDAVEYFLHTPTGNYLLGGALGAFLLLAVVTYFRFARRAAGNRTSVIKGTASALMPFPLLIGALLLLRLMPFGNAYGFSIAEAVYTTGWWSGVGEGASNIWIYITAGIMVIAMPVAMKKAPRLVLPLGVGYAATIFFVLAIAPAAGAGEADLGLTYFLLLFVAFPALLLGTSFRLEGSKKEE